MAEEINKKEPMWGIVSVSIGKIHNLRNQFTDNEENGFLNISLNANLVLNFASFVEGAVKDILIGYLSKTTTCISEERKNGYLKELLEKKGYSDTVQFFPAIIGKDIKDIINKDVRLAIEKLFQMRNAIIHGNAFNVAEGEIQGKYNSIYNYFIEKSLIIVDEDNQKSARFLFQNSVIDYLLENLCQYIDELLKINDMPNYPKYFMAEYLRQYIKPLIK